MCCIDSQESRLLIFGFAARCSSIVVRLVMFSLMVSHD
jgi:hypothetical protein